MSKKHIYTIKELDFLRNNISKYWNIELTEKFNQTFSANVTINAIKSTTRHYGIKRNVEPKITYTSEENLWLKENARKFSTWADVAKEMNKLFFSERTPLSLKCRCNRYLKLFIHDNYLKISGGCNTRPIGTETKRSMGYTYIKIGKSWIEKRRYIFEQAYGSIPKGFIVVSLDQNHNNFELENLYCISRAAGRMMSTNKWWTNSKEHTLTAIKWCELFYALKNTKNMKGGTSMSFIQSKTP